MKEDRITKTLISMGFVIESIDESVVVGTYNTERGQIAIQIGHPFRSTMNYTFRLVKPNRTVKWYYEKTLGQTIRVIEQVAAANLK